MLSSGRFFGQPVLQMQEFLDLPAFVAILQRFLGLMFQLAERMFWITNGFVYNVQGLTHVFLRFELYPARQKQLPSHPLGPANKVLALAGVMCFSCA